MCEKRNLLLLIVLACLARVGVCQTTDVASPSTKTGSETRNASVLWRTESGELVPLEGLLGRGVVDELLERALEQRDVPRFTIDQMEMTGTLDRNEVRLHVEIRVSVRPGQEWVTIPFSPGDIYVERFDSESLMPGGQAILTSTEQNTRRWHLRGRGQHTLKMDLVGKTRQLSPGVSQMSLNLPTSTASPHAVLTFVSPVELQKLPAGAHHRIVREEQTPGVRKVEFWLANDFSLTWAEIIPRVTQKPAIQVQNFMKLDLTTIPVTLTGTQQLKIGGSPVSEIQLQFPSGYQLQEIDARNANGVSVLQNFETTSADPPATLVRLTSAVEGSLSVSWELEQTNRQFPRDIRVSIPLVQNANLQSGELDMLFPTGLLVKQSELKDVQRKRVVSESDASVATTAFRLRSPESLIVLHVEETEAQFAVSPEITLQPTAQSMTASVRYQVTVLKGSLLDLAVIWPGWSSNEWQILPSTVRLIVGKSSVPLTYQPSEGEKDVLMMTFPERQSGEFFVEFQAFADLAAVRSGRVRLTCPEVQSRRGQPFLITTIESDEYSIIPVNMGTGERLTTAPVSASAAAAGGQNLTDGVVRARNLKSENWLLDNPSMPIRLELPAQASSVEAEIQLGMEPRETGIEVEETIRFEIEHRDLAGLSLQVPEGIRPIVRIDGSEEPLRAKIEASGWTFRLPEPRRGSLTARISFLWTAPMESAQAAEHIYRLPVILPNSVKVLNVEAGTSVLSGLQVVEETNWRPVFSQSFERAWQISQSVKTIPLKWTERMTVRSAISPDILLVRTQIVAGQCWTSTIAAWEHAPDLISAETPDDLQVDAATAGTQSLTSATGGRLLMRTERLSDRRIVRWRIDTRALSFNRQEPLVIEFRVRESLPRQTSLLLRSAFRRATVVGESSSVPVVWCVGVQDEYQLAGYGVAYTCLTQQQPSLLAGSQVLRSRASRQMQAVFSAYPESMRLLLTDRVDDWLAQSGRTDVYLGAGSSGSLTLKLVPTSTLVLFSAVVCLVVFLMMSIFHALPVLLPVPFAACLAVLGWLVWPEWTFVLVPYAAVGLICGLVAFVVQRILTDRRIILPKSSHTGDFPSVFGYTEMLSSAVAAPSEQPPKPASQPDFSLGSSR